ncbi:hypothetical protein HPP92_018124 [Vanilla planifolia]|uniref:AP2/ERF domain-containing protein n=1 Tax=Vanilla planifolia TaxID=51239 RepID=A0A835QDD9_VANPL|nr:hypothetical protein HPP92_018712 [Vanilla planifolia]KAG0468796.1 hypothetical protein HPP92_018124 [Vanilla planifolia]
MGFGSVGLLRDRDLKPLGLSMSPASRCSCVGTAPQNRTCSASENKSHGFGMSKKRENGRGEKKTVHRNPSTHLGRGLLSTEALQGRFFISFSSHFFCHLGHLLPLRDVSSGIDGLVDTKPIFWDNSCKKEGQTRKGRQGLEKNALLNEAPPLLYFALCFANDAALCPFSSLPQRMQWNKPNPSTIVYLGGYDMEEKAARAYDLAALKYWGPSTHINFPLQDYQDELEQTKGLSRQEFVAHLRRKSGFFFRGASMYRGVTRHHQHGRWQARIGRLNDETEKALDEPLSSQVRKRKQPRLTTSPPIKFRGASAVTNFDMSRYDVERIMASSTLLAAICTKDAPGVGMEDECLPPVSLAGGKRFVGYWGWRLGVRTGDHGPKRRFMLLGTMP